MSLIIKGMKLPRSCSTCRFSYFTVGIRKRCEISGDEINPLINCRETNCPLVEVPTPHGRLIDVTTLKNKIESDYCNKCTDVEECGVCVCQNCGIGTLFDDIDFTPTIVEAEVSK